jgi:hypothetical protein
MNEHHKTLALEMALEGKDEASIALALISDHGARSKQAHELAAYVTRGEAGFRQAAGKNVARSQRKALAILLHNYDVSDGLATAAGDLLADLMHLSNEGSEINIRGKVYKTGFDLDFAQARAQNHYFAEQTEEG